MMRTIGLLILVLFGITFQKVNISLKLKDTTNEMLYMQTETSLDSCQLKDGIANFKFNRSTSTPEAVRIYDKSQKFNFGLFIEDNDIDISGSILDNKTLKFEGSNTQNETLAYMSILDPIKSNLKTFKLKRADRRLIDSIQREIHIKETEFSRSYPKSFVSLNLPFIAFQNKHITSYEALKWMEALKNNPYSEEKKRLEGIIRNTNRLVNGAIAPNFEMVDVISKKNISLKDFKGKIVVINFWASWCGPCIGEMPIFKEFISNNKENPNIIFLSISLDKNKSDLMAAIEKNKVKWPVLTDFKGEDSKIVLDYGVSPLPDTYIVSKDGTVEQFQVSSVYGLQKKVMSCLSK